MVVARLGAVGLRQHVAMRHSFPGGFLSGAALPIALIAPIVDFH
jgi:hypothetical protein